MKKKISQTEKSSLATLSRRQFLQATAATCLAASMMTACSGGDSQDDTFVPDNNDLDFKEGTWHKAYCGSCIWPNCGTEVKVQNGVAIEIRGNKEHPSNKGTLCPRGSAMLMNIYNPYRVKVPMKRTQNFGASKGLNADPGWQEITWEEALNTAIDKILALREPELADVSLDYRKLGFAFGFAASSHESPFMKLIRGMMLTPNVSTTAGPLCEVHHACTRFNGTFVDRVDVEYCEYLVAFGRNVGASTAIASGVSRALADAFERGMKLVSVDPHAGSDVSVGRENAEWIPILPHTDQAFGMAMLHLILDNGDWDEEVMQWRSNAPYLVRLDDDNYLREPGAESPVDITKKPLIWDAYDNTAKPFDDPTLTTPDYQYTGTVNGVAVTTGFNKVVESVATAPDGSGDIVDWAARVTGVPADDIRRITEEFVVASRVRTGDTIVVDGVTYPFRPAAVAVGRGSANNMQGQRFYILGNMINLVVGAIGVPGSLVTASEPIYTFEDGIMRYKPIAAITSGHYAAFKNRTNFNYGGQQFYPLAFFPLSGAFYGSVIDPAKYGHDYELEVLFTNATNPLMTNASPELITEVLRKIPFIFAVSYHLDETSMFCDIVMPDHSPYERTQIRHINENMIVANDSIQLRGLQFKEPAFDFVYNSRQFDDVLLDIVDAMGLIPKLNAMYSGFYGSPRGTQFGTPIASANPNLDPGTKYTYREMVDRVLKAYAKDDNKGIDWFKENGFFMRNTPLRECYEYYAFQIQHKSDGFTARLPLYNWDDYITGKYLKMALDEDEFFKGVVPGWEDKMHMIYEEYVAVPMWYDSFATLDDADFDMYAINWKITIRNIGVGGQDDNAWLREIVDKHEFDSFDIHINPETASAYALKNGDKIRVTSQCNGNSVTGTVKLTNTIHKKCIGFPALAGKKSMFANPICKKGTNYNDLLSNREGWIQPDSGAIPVSVKVKIEKA